MKLEDASGTLTDPTKQGLARKLRLARAAEKRAVEAAKKRLRNKNSPSR